ncbi:SusC/RagA family TonB-linked outer membrane protein [Hufsiella ginkgonis]|uniref:SusC/RagA family TonB-linked outer membrane protein n=1 Tax=Hufsiella ginkgonis TaxID=2695274 RepID=A0A7K1XW27_9SPHI|nr:SusC/RagA family TonB-linked outer membrane protein [Hufsiella ginkgonis]MXV15195.1 SusC/RagA family TonB-linked outer membrane protein [Hufsiella ginkgonis]
MNLKQLLNLSGTFLLLLFACSMGYAQERAVTGKAVDKADGSPMIGLIVSVKGRPSNVSTNGNGEFSIRVTPSDSVLVFSYIGYIRQQVKIGDRSSIIVTMEPDTKSLDEVVVVGYGTQKRETLTGSIATLTTKDIEDLPVSNIGAALAGRLLGVGVSGGTQRPGSTATITVRNPNTFLSKDGGTTSPLFVIDDVIQVTSQGAPDNTLFNSLDISEIESLSVLKDAAAAIYGSRAANGVIVVRTKRGKDGKPRISYNGSYAVNDEAFRTKMLSAADFARYYNIMNGPNGRAATNSVTNDNVFTAEEIAAFENTDHNWLDDAWKASHNMHHGLSVSGGANKATYFANASYYTQDGNMGALEFSRWNFRGGADVEPINNLKVGLQLSGNFTDQARTFNKIGSETLENDYVNLLTTPRYIPEYINGVPVKIPGTNAFAGYHFFEIERLGNIQSNDDRVFTVNVSAEYKLPWVKGLGFRLQYATNFANNNGGQVGTTYTLTKFTGTGTNIHILDDNAVPIATTPTSSYSNGDRLYYSQTRQKRDQTNFFVTYERSFGKHSVSALATVEKSEAEAYGTTVLKEKPLQGTNGMFNTAFGAIDGTTTGNESGTLGYIGRANYNYSSKYLAEFLFRSDASTKFAPDNYWGRFYSGSVGWVVSEESFFTTHVLDYLKVRYSLGKLGNDQTKAWLWRQRYTPQEGKGLVLPGTGGNNNTNTATTTGYKMEASPNPDATWSDELKHNLGFDMRFLNNRLSATLEGYYNKATNILIEPIGSVPATVGGSIASTNFGAANFYGYEIGLGWNAKAGKDVNYGINLNFNWGDNKVIKMNYTDISQLQPWSPHYGESSDNGKWGYDVLGMFKNQEEIDAYVAEYKITQVHGNTIGSSYKLTPGQLYYRDIRGKMNADGTFAAPDGIIDENDQVQLAKKAVNHYGFGIVLRAGWKGLSFDAAITGSFGGFAEMDARNKMETNISNAYSSVPAYWANIYDPVLNPSGTLPNPNWSNVSLDKTSKFWQVSAFRMGFRNANLNYSLPKKLVQRAGISNARVSLTALNPVILYNPYDYRDPDAGWNTYPNLRTISLGLNATF